jgi:hypothetical protein
VAGEKSVRFKIEAENKAQEGIKSAVRDLLGIDEAAQKVGDTLKSAFTVLALVETTKRVAEFGMECIKAFGDAERSQLRLKAAFDGNNETTNKMLSLMDDLSERTTESKDSIEQMVSSLAALGRSPAEIDKISKATVNLSNATGKDLNSSMMMLMGTYEGATGKLEKLLPGVSQLTTEQLAAGGAVDLVNQKLTKISDEMAGGVSQKLANLNNSFSDFTETLGQCFWNSQIADGLNSLLVGLTSALQKYNDFANAVKRPIEQSAIDKFKAIGGTDANLGNFAALKKKFAEDANLQFSLWGEAGGKQNFGDKQWISDLAKQYKMTRDQVLGLILDTQNLDEAQRNSVVQQMSLNAIMNRKKADDAAVKTKADQAPDSEVSKLSANSKIVSGLREQFDKMERSFAYFGTDMEDQFKQLDQFQFNFEEATRGLNFGPEGKRAFDDLTKAIIDGKNGTSGPMIGSGSYSGGSDSAQTGLSITATELSVVTDSPSSGLTSGGTASGSNSPFSLDSFVVGLTEILGPISGIIAPMMGLFSTIASLADPMTYIMEIANGLVAVIGPALDQVIKPLFDALNSIGQALGQALMPILLALAPVFSILAEIIVSALLPVIQLLTPGIQLMATLLQILNPILKAAAIVFEILMAPVKFIADLFAWVGAVVGAFGRNVATAIWNITHWFDQRGYDSGPGAFSSDAFSGLAGRIKAIIDGTAATTAPGTTSTSTGGTTGASATYTGGQDITLNFYNNGNVVGNQGIVQLAIELKNIIDNQVRLGAV